MNLNLLRNLAIVCGPLAMSACHQSRDSRPLIHQQEQATVRNVYPTKPAADISDLRKLSAQEERNMHEYFPAEMYAKFPNDIRYLLRRADFEHDICKTGPGAGGPNGVRAARSCDASDALLIAIENNGWCWGGSTTESDKRWVRCQLDLRSGCLLEEGQTLTPDQVQACRREADASIASQP